MIVALGLSLNVATIIHGFIFSMLPSDFRACGTLSIPTPHIKLLTEFFPADVLVSIHQLPVSWYLIFLLWVYQSSCMHIISILWSIAEAVSSGSWPILFKILTLSVAICIMRLYLSNLFLKFQLCSWFFKTYGQVSNFSRTHSFFTVAKNDAVLRFGLCVSHGKLSMAVLLFSSNRSHLNRWIAAVPWLILSRPLSVGFVHPDPG